MYYTILERVLNYLSVGMKIIHVHRRYIPNFFPLLREDFMKLEAILVTFFMHVLKILVFCFSLGQQ